jgi:glycosyltransferase involved in cell wall biosynthesis
MIWIDVEDLFQHFQQHGRPTGIQRVEYELCRAFADMPEMRDEVRFVRHKVDGYYTVPFALLASGFRDFAGGASKPANRPLDHAESAPRSRGALYRALRHAAHRFPPPLRLRLIRAYYHQKEALRSVVDFARAGVAMLRAPRDTARIVREAEASAAQPPPWVDPTAVIHTAAGARDFDQLAGAGDILMLLGSAWWPGYAASIARIVRDRGLRLALLVYDIIPAHSPEYFPWEFSRQFSTWLREMLPLVDVPLTISRSSAADLERHAAATGLALRGRPCPIPMGTGFTAPHPMAPSNRSPAPKAQAGSRALPPAGSYALIVSTIEARKNHALLFRVWRRLLADMPSDSVPTLVFAGRVGWLVDDLMTQLRNAAFLHGKIVLIEQPSDGELATLYQGCLFTLFPSFYEGWGLPVTESLGYGRPCIISNAASLPEAGGTLARYFDPDNAAEAYAVIRAAIEDPEGLASWGARIAREFTPVPWDRSARAILAALEPTPPRNADAGQEPALAAPAVSLAAISLAK